MTKFYEELISGKSKDKSLRQSKLNYIQESDHLAAHPFYWAGQIAIGDMQELEFESGNATYWLVGLVLLIFLIGIFWKRIGRW